MLNLRKRIKELQENTSSIEAKDICKEVLETFINVPEMQISNVIVEKLKTSTDADKHVKKFIQIAEKIDAISNLGVARSLAILKESQIYSYPALKYGLAKIENDLIYKQIQVVESSSNVKDFKAGDVSSALNVQGGFTIKENNMAGKPEFMLIDSLNSLLKSFIWDSVVEKIYTDLKTKRTELNESIDIAISLYRMKNEKGSFFFDTMIPKLEEHLINPTENSRASIIEDLRKLNFYPIAKSLSESLMKIHKDATKGVQIISDNSKCTISSIYSPVLLENGSEYFYSRGNFFSKTDGKIAKINEETTSNLPEKFKEICRIVSSPNVFIKEGKISFYIKRDKVEILENENNIEVKFNGNSIPSKELAKHMVSAGLFRLEESKVAYDVQMIAESFKSIFDLDFAKIIESNIHTGSYVILMKDGTNIYLNKVNESMRSNEFFSDTNATQARNIIMEFLGFDIKESLSEYLEQDEVAINTLRESQIEVLKNIAIVEANLNKVNNTLQDAFMSSTPELMSLKDMLESEMNTLKDMHRSISGKIKAFENKSSDAGFVIGDEVILTDNGDSATITSINSTTDTVTVVTSKGKTMEVPTSKVTSQEAHQVKTNDKNAEPIKGEVKTDESVEEVVAEEVTKTVEETPEVIAEEATETVEEATEIVAEDAIEESEDDKKKL